MVCNDLSELEKDVVKMRYQMGAILLIHINEHLVQNYISLIQYFYFYTRAQFTEMMTTLLRCSWEHHDNQELAAPLLRLLTQVNLSNVIIFSFNNFWTDFMGIARDAEAI